MNTYTNPQMLSPEELHKAHLEMAKNYLESKWDGYYYEVDPYTGEPRDEDDEIVNEYEGFEDFDAGEDNAPSCSSEAIQEDIVNDDVYEQQRRYYIGLTNEQFSEIQKRIKESGKNVLSKALSNDPELKQLFLYKYSPEEAKYAEKYFDYAYAERIGDIPHVVCNISVCTMIDATQKPDVFPYSIMLTKEEYLKLLVIFMDHRDVTFNDLYEYDLELFKKISKELTTEAKKHSEKNNKQSYTLVFDEIEEDVHALLGEDESDVWYEDEEAYTDKRIHLEVRFSEKKMSVVQLLYDINGHKKYILYNVNAKRVLKVLNVNTYHDALISLKDRFYIPHVVTLSPFYKIKEFLDKQEIGYEYSFEVTD